MCCCRDSSCRNTPTSAIPRIWVLLGSAGFYRVLQGSFGVLQGSIGNWVLLGSSRFFKVLQGSTGFYKVRSRFEPCDLLRMENLPEPEEPCRTGTNPVEPGRTQQNLVEPIN